MGRRNFKKGKTFGARNDRDNGKGWSELVRENAKWEEYYQQLSLFPADQWDKFKSTCQAALPLTFRITGSKSHALEILALFKERHLPNLTGVEFEGETLKAPMELPWYPAHLGWQLDVPKTVIRKNVQFAKVQRFLVVENAVGNISRQEAVSMIPPILLEVEPHHAVLDMCAAPGSKTAQMIEALHRDNDEPSGFVVANDADAKRSHMLVHQLKRLNSANLIVVNHDAQFFPRIKANSSQKNRKDILRFDRVLCDVPCSGDGTMRKNVNVWRDWSPQNGLALHVVQFNILNRGLHLLSPGGRLVYSTCSMNPIENEAVVAEALRKWGGQVKLVDCSEKLPGLVRSQGINQWPVVDRNMQIKERGEEGTIESWFPPTEEEASRFHLENCVRVYPHQQNTGGFFITVFEKAGELDSHKSVTSIQESASKSENGEEGAEAQEPAAKRIKTDVKSNAGPAATTPTVPVPNPEKKERLPRDANEEPFSFVDPNNEAMKNCWKFYGIDDKFDKNTCLVRNATGDPTRVVYTVCPALRDLIQANDERLKIIYSGVRLFVSQKSELECPWRIQSEALPIMKHHMTSNRVIKTNEDILKILLEDSFPNLDAIADSHVDSHFVQRTRDISSGCAFIEVIRDGPNKENLFLPVWKGKKCINLMVCKEDTHELLYRLFGVENLPKNGKNDVKDKKSDDTKKTDEGKADVAKETPPQETNEQV
ncbi:NCL1 (YBL024W) [Zygosaccharomyces parabailii]|nr:NCL1 (YBL024W) [Zygosaccharomyces parabailii]